MVSRRRGQASSSCFVIFPCSSSVEPRWRGQRSDKSKSRSFVWVAVAVILILLIIIAVILAVLGVFIWMIFLVYRAGGAVPAEHQRMDPGMVWLMVIPVFQTIWAFFVASRICGGLSAAFEARGLDRGDCGRFKGMAYAVSMVLQLVLSIVGGGLQLVGSLRMSNMSTGTESPPPRPLDDRGRERECVRRHRGPRWSRVLDPLRRRGQSSW